MGDDKPSALTDLRKGLGLLFRAAKTAAEKLPKGSVEEVVATSAREVGRAFENVASTIEREVFGRRGTSGKSDAKSDSEPGDPSKKDPGSPASSKSKPPGSAP